MRSRLTIWNLISSQTLTSNTVKYLGQRTVRIAEAIGKLNPQSLVATRMRASGDPALNNAPVNCVAAASRVPDFFASLLASLDFERFDFQTMMENKSNASSFPLL